jgi:hypothetical protein
LPYSCLEHFRASVSDFKACSERPNFPWTRAIHKRTSVTERVDVEIVAIMF